MYNGTIGIGYADIHGEETADASRQMIKVLFDSDNETLPEVSLAVADMTKEDSDSYFPSDFLYFHSKI